jgi:hypothetical protein
MPARNTTLVPGTPVRLSFDTGRKSVGYVIEILDAVRVRLEFPSDVGVHDGEFFDGRAAVLVLPSHVVVPVCEWVETYADEWGLACSEPGVPTSFDVPCHHDATTTVYPPDSMDCALPVNLCPEHTRESLAHVLAEQVRTEPIA